MIFHFLHFTFMKKIPLLALLSILCLSPMFSLAQQNRRVYITLDVSGSMKGERYALGNYTTQMLATVCDDDDDVVFIVQGKEIHTSSGGQGSKISQIQYPINHFATKGAFESQFNDIVTFNRVYKPSPDRQDWLFIVGDGYWCTDDKNFAADRRKFKDIVESGTLMPCFLQTADKLSETSDFAKFVEDFGIVDIRKANTDTKTIIDGCNYFTKKIMGFSDVNLKTKSSNGGKGVVITADLPVSEYIVVVQDDVPPSQLPSLNGATAAGSSLNVALKGTPSTHKLRASRHWGLSYKPVTLSGRVWRVKSSSPLPAATPVELLFDRSVPLSSVTIYPLVADKILNAFTLRNLSATKDIDAHTSAICHSERKASVVVELDNAARNEIPENLFKEIKVVVKANNKSYKAKYDGSNFVCDIDLRNTETQYYAEVDCPGYFHHTTPMKKIVKTKDCDNKNPAMETKTMPEIDLGSLTLQQLQGVDFVLGDEETKEILDPDKFDLAIELEHPFLYDDPVIRTDGDRIHVEVRILKDICECLVPSELKAVIVATPKEGALFDGGKQYQSVETPIRASIVKTRPFLQRCLWVLAVIGLLIVFLLYLHLLKNKCRFKKSAVVKPCHINEIGKRVSRSGFMLRRKGIGPWLCRWLLPFDEKRDVVSNKQPHASFTFVATPYKSRIQFPFSQFDKGTMRVTGFDPRTMPPARHGVKQYVPLGDGGEIDIRLRNGMKDGSFLFEAGSRDDEGAYITFLVILMLLSIITISSLLFLMLKGLWGGLAAWLVTPLVAIVLFWIFVLGKK